MSSRPNHKGAEVCYSLVSDAFVSQRINSVPVNVGVPPNVINALRDVGMPAFDIVVAIHHFYPPGTNMDTFECTIEMSSDANNIGFVAIDPPINDAAFGAEIGSFCVNGSICNANKVYQLHVPAPSLSSPTKGIRVTRRDPCAGPFTLVFVWSL